MADWNAAQYLAFEKERTQPSVDLANRLTLNGPGKILDVGCGPGNSTAVLGNRFPEASILGIDNSPDMIRTARENYSNLCFSLCDADKELGALDRDYDIVFSNACLQWVPDHPRLLRNLMERLKPGGILAVQVPCNYEEPIHHIITELVASPEWKEKFSLPRIFYTLTTGEYYDLLSELATELTFWQTTYFHVMKSHEDIVAWYRSTGLRPYLEELSEEDKIVFENEVLTEVRKAYPKQKNGDILFRFPRLFFTVRK